MKQLLLFMVFLPVLFIGFSHQAYAYLDPGTGSLVLQLLIGGILGALVTIKMYWTKIKNYFISDKNNGE